MRRAGFVPYLDRHQVLGRGDLASNLTEAVNLLYTCGVRTSRKGSETGQQLREAVARSQ